jgi:TRAP-type C4-dicarboxylate transport system substrate-binding protein
MKPLRLFVLSTVLSVFALGTPLAALTIKMGSMAPASSPWGVALNKLAARWHRITDGQVSLKLYLGGIAGNEPDMLRKMRIGQLHAAAITALGLNYITSEVLTLNLPFFIQEEDEFDYVLKNVRSKFEEKISEKGFTVLAWSFAGWVHLFSRNPVLYPRDLKGQKLGVPTQDNEILSGWRAMGFDAVSLSVADIMVGLESGMIDAYYATPMVAAAFQWFGIGNHMSLLRVLPIYGAIIINNDVWKLVPEKHRPAMMEALQEAERIFASESEALEEKALAVMERHGLVIHPVPDDAQREWRDLMTEGFKGTIGKTFSREFYETVKGYLEEFRAR